jgi:hypothetical protein
MGISLEEYLKDRAACDVCDATGDQEHCVTTLLSREDSCIFFNALSKNSNPVDDNDVAFLQNFRSLLTEEEVLAYYIRASKIVREINGTPNDHTALWDGITVKYVQPILELVKSSKHDEALTSIQTMLQELETGE